MKKRIHLFIGIWMLMAVTAVAAKGKFTLVIDPGHGGHDTGAIGKITKEKTINLNVALAFGRLVERNCPDVKVIYTRKTDVFIPLHTRADIANRNKADLFISIHTNALPKKRISRGLETYTLGMHRAADNLEVAKRENEVILYEKDYKQRYQGFDPNSSESYIMFEFMQDHNMAQSVELAKFVQRRTCAAAGRQNKGVKQAGFLVLRETSMPSCLIELGFISTPDEEQFLNSQNGVSRLGSGIYQAFLDYKRKYDSTTSVPLKVETQPEVSAPAVVAQAKVEDKQTRKLTKQEKKEQEKLKKEQEKLQKEQERLQKEQERQQKEQEKLQKEQEKLQKEQEKQARQQTKEEKKRTKSRMAQELADAREGKDVDQAENASSPTAPSVDSIVSAAPVVARVVNEVAKAEPAKTEPVAPVVTKAESSKTAIVATTKTEPAKVESTKTEPASKTESSKTAIVAPVASKTESVASKTESVASKTESADAAPVFKVQIMACDVQLRAKDPRLKGVNDATFYQEGGLYKYTVGASANYSEISSLRKTLSAKFPQAFIIAFKNGQKMNVQTAIQEYKANKNKK